MTSGLVDSALYAASREISYLLPTDDCENLCNDLHEDQLVQRELSNIAELLVLKGERLVALASGLFKVAKHIKLGEEDENANKIVELDSKTEQVN